MTTSNIWQCLIAAQDLDLWRTSQKTDIEWWRSKDGQTCRGYAKGKPETALFPWVALEGVVELAGASHGQDAPFHYVVETDVDDANLAELNDWYEQEHLPGLAAVPGTEEDSPAPSGSCSGRGICTTSITGTCLALSTG